MAVHSAHMRPQKVHTCCTAHKMPGNTQTWIGLCSSLQLLAELAQLSFQGVCCVGHPMFCALCCCSWRDHWQQMDVFHRWVVAAQHRHAMRFMTAAAYEHRYLTLGRATIAAWKEGVQHNHRVSMPAVLCAVIGREIITT